MKHRGIGWTLGLALAVAVTPAWAAQKISIATGGTGGVYYPYGGGMAEIINKYVPETEAVAEVTGASVENVRLVDKGESAIGLVMGDTAFQRIGAPGLASLEQLEPTAATIEGSEASFVAAA